MRFEEDITCVAKSKYESMIFCDHANEHPHGVCRCPKNCGCREFMCKMEDHGRELGLFDCIPKTRNDIDYSKSITLAGGALIQQEKQTKVAQNPKFHAVLQKMAEMHDKKNHDYAQAGNPYSNFEEAAAFANTSVDTVFRVMMGIKMARLNELVGNNKTPNNESIQDTRLDLAVYAALYVSYFDGDK